ncbi:MAG: carboxypeptidase-like regulatory domain-containing protein [Bradymonadia bacterium]
MLSCQAEPSRQTPTGTSVDYLDAQGLSDEVNVSYDAFFERPFIRDAGGSICPTGSIGGSVCAPNGDVLYGATIRAESEDCEGRPYVKEVTSDEQGRFQLDNLPASFTEVTIQSGVFTGRYGVDVEVGQLIGLTDSGTTKVCFPTNSAGLGVLSGDYDKVENLISELGFDHEVICGGYGTHAEAQRLLLDPVRLATFDILFINCMSGVDLRATNSETQQIKSNLIDFVRNGGSLYVSDLASDFITQLWPDVAEFDTVNPSGRELDVCCFCPCDDVCEDGGEDVEICDNECSEESNESTSTDPTESLTCEERSSLPMNCIPSIPNGRGQTGELPASVVSLFLQQATGLNNLSVVFNGDRWVEINRVDESVEVLVQSGTQPLMFLFQPYPNGGRVAYTSFHIHIQANEPMKKILRSLIFRL